MIPVHRAMQFAIVLYLVTHGVHPPAGGDVRDLAHGALLAALGWTSSAASLLAALARSIDMGAPTWPPYPQRSDRPGQAVALLDYPA